MNEEYKEPFIEILISDVDWYMQEYLDIKLGDSIDERTVEQLATIEKLRNYLKKFNELEGGD